MTGLDNALAGVLVALMDELPTTMFCVKDAGGRYTHVNDAFLRRTGERSRRSVLGRRPSDLFAGALAQRYEEQDARVLRTGKPIRDELELIRRGEGEAGWYVSTKLPVREEGEVVGLVSVSRDLRAPESDDLTAMSGVVGLVQARLADPPSVAELAEVAGLSAAALTRQVRKVFGLSPRQLVLRARLDHAGQLLTMTALPLSEVAYATGFYDQPAFTRTFAAHTGETPQQRRLRA